MVEEVDNLNNVILRHPKFPHIIFRNILDKEELLLCLKLYADNSVKYNAFIAQMQISADEFYEQGLKPYADQIMEDKYGMMAIDTSNGKNEIAAFRIGKDMVSHTPIKTNDAG